MNETDRYLPIANIGRIMKNTLDPPKEKKKKKQQNLKTANKKSKESIDRLFNNPDEEQKDQRPNEILPGVPGIRDDRSDDSE